MAYIVCPSNLELVSFLCVPALYSTLKFKEFFRLLISSLFVLSNVIVENIVGFTHVQGNRQLFFVVICIV